MRVVHTQTKDPTKRNLMKHEPALRIANKKKAGSSCFYVTKKSMTRVGIPVFLLIDSYHTGKSLWPFWDGLVTL